MTVNERMTAGNSPLLHYCKVYYHREGAFQCVSVLFPIVFDEFQRSHTTDYVHTRVLAITTYGIYVLFYQGPAGSFVFRRVLKCDS